MIDHENKVYTPNVAYKIVDVFKLIASMIISTTRRDQETKRSKNSTDKVIENNLKDSKLTESN